MTGALIMAWNEAHGELFDLFRWLCAEGDFDKARSLWLVIQSDDLRRRAVAAAAEAMTDRRTLKTAIGWATDRLADLSQSRNFATHVYFRDWGDELAPDYFSTADNKLNKIESQKWFEDAPAITGDLYALADYIRGISMALGPVAQPRPNVRKPRLQSFRFKQAPTSRHPRLPLRSVRHNGSGASS